MSPHTKGKVQAPITLENISEEKRKKTATTKPGERGGGGGGEEKMGERVLVVDSFKLHLNAFIVIPGRSNCTND